MKECDDIKDLILTDFIDGQLEKEHGRKVESHLLECSECRAFFKEVKNSTILPIQQARQQPVPVELWAAIKLSIEHDNQLNHPLEDFMAQLKGMFVFPRLVPVLASFIVMFLVGSFTLNNIHIQQAKDKEQGEYLIALLGSASLSAQADSNDLGTPIEHYFL